MTASWPRRVVLLSVLSVLGCDGAQELQWDARFADPAVAMGVVAFEATIESGGCTGGEMIYSLQFPSDGPGVDAPAPPVLDPGTYGFRLSARDSLCRNVATGCQAIILPDPAGVVEVVLEAQAPAAACAASLCTAGICAESDGGMGTECPPDRANCNISPEDGCEVDVRTDIANCGGCDMPCRTPHATPVCRSGACEIVSCDDDFFDCDGDASNGCETSILTLSDCGRCRMPGEDPLCALDHATETCDRGTCELVSCHDGWGDCDGNLSNGCETPLGTSDDCASCGDACGLATPFCDASGATPACVTVCPLSATICGSTCADVSTDPRHCGACGAACLRDNAEATCTAGACGLGACDPGWASCDGSGSSGCETSTTTVDDCGGCDVECAVGDAVTECVTGTCAISECFGARGDCNADVGDGCEADLGSATTCGDCATSCAPPTALCAAPSAGEGCVSTCPPPTVACGDRCLDVRFDGDNCGGCGVRCDASSLEYCAFGICETLVCGAGFADCDGVLGNGCEAFLEGDPDNCGSCDNVCATGPAASARCSGGACGLDCDPGRADCNGDPSDGCEAALDTDANCGACGNACSAANGSATCAGGACVVASCNSGFEDCNGLYADGCEIDTQTDNDNCGGCGSAGDRCRGVDDCCAGVCMRDCP